MSLLVQPAPLCSRKFLRRPNTYALRFPTGSDFYFSIPFNTNWLRPLRPVELAALRDYLSDILQDVANRMGKVGVGSVLDVRCEISARLWNADRLTEVENRAWAAGHGYPLFDFYNRLTGFFWDWNLIHFECGPSVAAWYVKWLYDFQHKPCFERYAVRHSMRFEENIIEYDWWIEDGGVIIKWYCNRDIVCFKIHGASFRDFDEWKSLETKLESYELDMLKGGTARLRNTQGGGWELVVFQVEGLSVTTSDSAYLGHAYEPHPRPLTAHYVQTRSPEMNEEEASCNPDCCGRYCFNQTPNQISKKDTAQRVQPADMWNSLTSLPSHSVPPHVSGMYHQVDDLANAVRNLNAQLIHVDRAHSSPYSSPASSLYPIPYPSHTVTPTPHNMIRGNSASTQQPYQAYAEDEQDEGVNESIGAVPNSWRDV